MNHPAATHSVTRISPKLVVADFDETLAFYTEVLRFRVWMKTPEYVIVERDGATIHFSLAADTTVLAAVRGHTEIYVQVEKIAALWEHVRKFTGKHRIRDLFERPYGMTEFHIEDPNGCLVFVGEPTEGHSPRDRAADD